MTLYQLQCSALNLSICAKKEGDTFLGWVEGSYLVVNLLGSVQTEDDDILGMKRNLDLKKLRSYNE